MLKQGAKNLLLYFLIFVLLVFIIAIPPNPTISMKGLAKTPVITYVFDKYAYQNNLKYFWDVYTKERSLGTSQYEGVMVEDELKVYLPRSLKIIGVAFTISLLLGIGKGIFDYRHRRDRLRFLGGGATWLMQSVPDFFIMLSIQWLALMLIPSFRIFSNSTPYNFVVIGIIVSIYPALYLARIVAAALQSEDGEQYITVARAKGFSERRVVYRHIFRNALPTILTHIPALMVYILSSLFMAEYLFAYEGLAYRMFFAIGIIKSVIYGQAYAQWEPAMTLGAILCFMILIMATQLIAALARIFFKLDRSLAK